MFHGHGDPPTLPESGRLTQGIPRESWLVTLREDRIILSTPKLNGDPASVEKVGAIKKDFWLQPWTSTATHPPLPTCTHMREHACTQADYPQVGGGKGRITSTKNPNMTKKIIIVTRCQGNFSKEQFLMSTWLPLMCTVSFFVKCEESNLGPHTRREV